MMNRKKNKFVLITSDACIHCSVFKQTILNELQERIIKDYKNIEWNHINIPTFEFKEKGYPKGLKNLISWYPILFLIPSELWDSGDLTKNLDKIQVLNGVIKNGRVEIDRKYSITLENILKWIDEYQEKIKLQEPFVEQRRFIVSDTPTGSLNEKKKVKFKDRRLIRFTS